MLNVKIIKDGKKQVTIVAGFVIGCSCCDEMMTATFAGDKGKDKFVVFTDRKEALGEAVEAGSDRIIPVKLVITKNDENKENNALLPSHAEGDHTAA